MAHLFLTGPLGVGKSTLITQALEGYTGVVNGFLTVSERTGALHAVYLQAITGTPRMLFATIESGTKTLYPNTLETLGVEQLQQSAAAKGITVLDELGYLEEEVDVFTQAVLERLANTRPILGVVRALNTPFLNAVRAHPLVQLVTVTPQNRDTLLPQLVEHINKPRDEQNSVII